MQKSKIGKFSIFNFLDIKLKFLMSWVKLTQFSVELSHVKLKIWAIWLELSWKCEQLDLILIQVQNVNLKLNLMISLTKTHYHECFCSTWFLTLFFIITLFVSFTSFQTLNYLSLCNCLNMITWLLFCHL